MVSLTRPLHVPFTGVSRDTSVASVWVGLNKMALQIGMWLGPLSGLLYVVGYLLTGLPAFLAMTLVAIGMTASCTGRLRAANYDSEALLLFGGFSSVIAVALVPPVARGALAAATIVVGITGVLVLPGSVRTRFSVIVTVLTLTPVSWPFFHLASPPEALSTLVITIPSLVFGFLAVGMGRSALERSERTRIEIFRRVPLGLFRSGPDGNLIDANPALAQMLGCLDTAELVGRDVAGLHEVPLEWEDFVERLEQSTEPQRFAHRMLRSDGAPLWVRGFAQAIRADNGTTLYHEGAIEDITQRREVEESARLNADRFRNVFERAPIAIWEEDYSGVGARIEELRAAGVGDIRQYLAAHPDEAAGLIEQVRFIDVNPAGIALLGASNKAEALQGLSPEQMPEEVAAGFIDQFEAIWNGEDSITIEIRGATLEGRATDLALSWAVGRTAEGALDLGRVIVAIQDIAMIRQAERDLAALVESKDDLVASVSHELRTPITAILGMAFELRDHGEAFARDETKELIEIIADQSRELSNIVEDLLVAAWSDADTVPVRLEVVNLTTEFGIIVPSGPTGPVVDVTRPILAWTDPLRFRQILRNLLTNASKYGGPNVKVTAISDGSTVRVQVSDDGPGVPLEDRNRIFDPYFRALGDRAMPGSLGLGLPVSRRLARLLGGDLTYRFDSVSIFELRLPAPIRGHFL
jgi:PAS domain S-box-containing protein